MRPIEECCARRYPGRAYDFLQRGLAHTAGQVHGQGPSGGPRHVTGQQLCHGLREVALQEFGLLAPLVLGRWNIRTTRDFGEMVFLLSRYGLVGVQPTDRIEDFDQVYDFADAFSLYQLPAVVVEP
jgi:uncharacterized repeat protein (TIGR04138 family)